MSRQHDDRHPTTPGMATRHLADHAHDPADGPRVRHFLRIDQAQRPAPVTLELQSRGVDDAAERSLAPFVRILHGRSA